MSHRQVSIGAQEALPDIQEEITTSSSNVHYRHKSNGKQALTMQGNNGTKLVQVRAESGSQQEAAIREMKLRQAVAAAASSL